MTIVSWALHSSGTILCTAGQNRVSRDEVLRVLLVWVFFLIFVCFLIPIFMPYFPLDTLPTRTRAMRSCGGCSGTQVRKRIAQILAVACILVKHKHKKGTFN